MNQNKKGIRNGFLVLSLFGLLTLALVVADSSSVVFIPALGISGPLYTIDPCIPNPYPLTTPGACITPSATFDPYPPPPTQTPWIITNTPEPSQTPWIITNTPEPSQTPWIVTATPIQFDYYLFLPKLEEIQ